MDAIFHSFLENSLAEAQRIAAASDVLRILPLPPTPASRYLCEFRTPYLRRTGAGVVEIAPGPVAAGLRFPEDYLRSTDTHLFLQVASVLTPDIAHPNIRDGMVCLGAQFGPGTPIRALLHELHEILTYQNYTLDERNAMNPEACRLLRAHPGLLKRLPAPPLIRRQARFRVEVTAL